MLADAKLSCAVPAHATACLELPVLVQVCGVHCHPRLRQRSGMEEFEDSLSNTVRLPHAFFELLVFFFFFLLACVSSL